MIPSFFRHRPRSGTVLDAICVTEIGVSPLTTEGAERPELLPPVRLRRNDAVAFCS